MTFWKRKSKDDFYIFLDIDGVLNKKSDWRIPFSLNKECVTAFSKYYHYLENSYESVKVVLISTWRNGMVSAFNDTKAPHIEKLENTFLKKGISIFGNTPVSDKTRQEEVFYYIRRHNVKEYMIIDDDISGYSDINSLNIYVPDYQTGLTSNDVKILCKM